MCETPRDGCNGFDGVFQLILGITLSEKLPNATADTQPTAMKPICRVFDVRHLVYFETYGTTIISHCDTARLPVPLARKMTGSREMH
jgi:hypothetical protein